MTTAPPRSAYAKQAEHLQSAMRSGHAFGIERAVRILLCGSAFIMPVTAVREIGGRLGLKGRKLAVELYAIAKPTLLGILLWSGALPTVAPWIAAVFLVDLYLYLLGLLLLSDIYTKPFSARRSFVLLVPNFVEHLLGFALVYLTWGAIGVANGTATRDPGTLVFFSVVTTATVGFGDLVPLDRATRWLVVAQICASILFLSILLSTATSRLNGAGTQKSERNSRPRSSPPTA